MYVVKQPDKSKDFINSEGRTSHIFDIWIGSSERLRHSSAQRNLMSGMLLRDRREQWRFSLNRQSTSVNYIMVCDEIIASLPILIPCQLFSKNELGTFWTTRSARRRKTACSSARAKHFD